MSVQLIDYHSFMSSVDIQSEFIFSSPHNVIKCSHCFKHRTLDKIDNMNNTNTIKCNTG